jgi:hypothetical protein
MKLMQTSQPNDFHFRSIKHLHQHRELGAHELVPVEFANNPAEHVVQTLLPGALAKEPTAYAAQAVDPEESWRT